MRILVIAPHADDETLGMGATIALRVAAGDDVTVAVLTGPGDAPHPLWPPGTWETIRGEASHAMESLGVGDLLFSNLPAALVRETATHIVNEVVASVIDKVQPDELYLPYFHDLHQDHAAIAYAGLVQARPYLARGSRIKLVAMYETPTETHLFPPALAPSFSPNLWVDVSATIEAKLQAWACYASQHHSGRTPRSPEAVAALATVRGAEIGCDAAEAFIVLRLIRAEAQEGPRCG